MTNSDDIPAFNMEDFCDVKYNPTSDAEYENSPVAFYCSDCKKLVKGERQGKTLKFVCGECGGKRVSYGTENSLKNYFKL